MLQAVQEFPLGGQPGGPAQTVMGHGKTMGDSMQPQLNPEMTGGGAPSEVRVDLLKRLAEQAMSDPGFRADARQDLADALMNHGYDLNEREFDLVTRFRAALADAGIDLDLVAELDLDNAQVAALLEKPGDSSRETKE